MPITEKELLSGILSKTLNMDASGVAALYNADGTVVNDDAIEVVLKADAERVAKIKPDTKKFFDDGYKKATAEIAGKKESEFAKAIGLETELKGEEFISAVEEHVSKKVTAGAEITEDAVKAHPAFKKREKELLAQVKEEIEKATAQTEKNTKETVRKETLSKVYSKAVAAVKDKALLPADEQKAMKQLQLLLLDRLAVYEYEVNESGDVVGITKDGKRLEDAHGNARQFDEIVMSTATENGMEFKVADEKDSANKSGNNQAPPGKKPIVQPKTKEEYDAFISNKEIPAEDKKAVIKEWIEKV